LIGNVEDRTAVLLEMKSSKWKCEVRLVGEELGQVVLPEDERLPGEFRDYREWSRENSFQEDEQLCVTFIWVSV
jgi:hypothetical protein